MNGLIDGSQCALAISAKLVETATNAVAGVPALQAAVNYTQNLLAWQTLNVQWIGTDKSKLSNEEIADFAKRFDDYALAMVAAATKFTVYGVSDVILPGSARGEAGVVNSIEAVFKAMPKFKKLIESTMVELQKTAKITDLTSRIEAQVKTLASMVISGSAIANAWVLDANGLSECSNTMQAAFGGPLPTIDILNSTISAVGTAGQQVGKMARGAVNGTITVVGGGFASAKVVLFSLWSTPIELGVATSDESGMVTARFTLPSGVDIGRHVLVATGTGVDGGPRVLLADVDVAGADDISKASASAQRTTPITRSLLIGLLFAVGGALLVFSLFHRRRLRPPRH